MVLKHILCFIMILWIIILFIYLEVHRYGLKTHIMFYYDIMDYYIIYLFRSSYVVLIISAIMEQSVLL